MLAMYTTGTVLVVILRAPPLRNMLTAEKQRELQDSWGTCIENLEHYHRSGIAVAAKCIATLRKIYDEGELERQQHSGIVQPLPFSLDTSLFLLFVRNNLNSHSSSSIRFWH